ncbi:hypothetical protein BU17DRAFT_82314 [Hysterangium stoloniferum]|nr:hypothetical protein BU17DRAFT_82314 [Hysterangium stoloniferum]
MSLLLSNLIQSVGSLLNIHWLRMKATVFGPVCVAQGITKNVGNVGTAVWSLVLALHAFDVLFLRRTQRRATLIITLLGSWALIFCTDMFGIVILQNKNDGPFFGISGYWCWITQSYPRARLWLEYAYMFTSAGLCGIIYVLIYLRLRGNISGSGWSLRLRRIPKSERWAVKLSRDEIDSRLYKFAKQLVLYPLAYTLIIIPIAVARFIDFCGMDVPFWFTISADFFFNLNGCFNVLIFAITIRYTEATYNLKLSSPRKSLQITNFGITPFVSSPSLKRTFRIALEKGGQDLCEELKTEGVVGRESRRDHDMRRDSGSTIVDFYLAYR